jgi:hypothetical protein
MRFFILCLEETNTASAFCVPPGLLNLPGQIIDIPHDPDTEGVVKHTTAASRVGRMDALLRLIRVTV